MNLIKCQIILLLLVEVCVAAIFDLRIDEEVKEQDLLPKEIPDIEDTLTPILPKYVIYIPKTIRNGLNLTFTIQLMNDDNPVIVVGNFKSTDGSLNFTNQQIVQPDTSAVMYLGQVPVYYNGVEKFELEIQGFKVGDDKGEPIFSRTASAYDFKYERKCSSILMQTDKAIYKPGQAVKFRAVIVSADLLPLNHTVTYEMRTSAGIIVMIRKNQPTVTGVVYDEFQLHPTAREGKWKIIFTDDVTKVEETIEFEVAIYKLPKFEVKVTGPSYISADMKGITVQVSAKYTYGQPVRGKASCTITSARYKMNQFTEDVKIKEFHGDTELYITKDQLRSLHPTDVYSADDYAEDYPYDGADDDDFDGEASIECRVFEQHTDIEMSDRHQISLTKYNIKIEEIFTPSTYKPGLNYTAYVKITEYDGKPLMDDISENNEIVAIVTYKERYHWWGTEVEQMKELEDIQKYSIPPSGIVPIHIKTSIKKFDFAEIRCYGVFFGNQSASVKWSAERATSPSMNFIQISTEDNKVYPGEEVHFTFTSTEYVSAIEVMVLTRGRTVATETIKPATNEISNRYEYNLIVTHEMQPSITVLASYIREDGEVVADFTTLNVQMSLLNKLKVSTSLQNLDAGDHLTINITSSSPHNFLALRAIDTSVLLLADGNDVTNDLVKKEMESYTSSSTVSERELWWWWPTPSTAQSSEEVFDQAGVIIIMDDRMLQPVIMDHPINNAGGQLFFGQGEPIPMMFPVMMMDSAPPVMMMDSASKKMTPRNKFPESWLWLNEFTDEEGKFELNTNVPDTITSWEISAISMSPTQGLAIAEKSKVTVFRNFFVNLNLPLKVTRGEIIIVQAIVFNYFPHDLQVTLQLHVEKDDFEFLMPIDDDELAGTTRIFSISADNSQSVWFPIRMTSIGDVSIKITAQSEIAYDSLIRTVHVKPEGIEQCFSQSELYSRSREENEEITKSQLEIKLPKNIVPDSASVTLHVYGDVMGSTINNLGQLLKTPTGCGEQNMVNFAPNVFITLYLERTNKLTEELKRKAYKHFNYGYQNQLNYQRKDGSFSAFGNRDHFGSLWLTAFVLKCFKHATKLEDGVAEQLDENIKKSVQFITEHLRPDGRFDDHGTICHRELQGGVNSDITMAAYITIALMEVSEHDDILNLSEKRILLRETLGYLETHLNNITDSPYELSIVTYALHLLDSDMADEAFDYLNKLSNGGETFKFWSQSDDSAATYKDNYTPGKEPTSSINIEMTSYALLTYLRRGEIISASPIMKWLASNQNSQGGFGNTQDTVLAIQAMASMAEYLVQDEENLKITFTQVDQPQQGINLTEKNFQVYNRFDLYPANGMVDIEVEGVGIGVSQLSICYNINESPYTNTPFDCYFVDGETGDLNNASLMICCSLRQPSTGPTGMLLYKVNLPSGFGIDVVRNLNKNNAKKVEFEKGSANLYFDELLPNQEICAELEITREQEVAASKPATITVQDYYRPKRSLVMEYSLSRMEKTDVCGICGENCAGCPRENNAPINYTVYIKPKPINYTINEPNNSNTTAFNNSTTWNNTTLNNFTQLNTTTSSYNVSQYENVTVDSLDTDYSIVDSSNIDAVAVAGISAILVVIVLLAAWFL